MTEKYPATARAKPPDLRVFPAFTDAGDGGKIDMEAAKALIVWSSKYALDAWAGHTCFMYGKPYVTEKGAVANAHGGKGYRGYTFIKVRDDEIRELGYPDPVAAWECSVYIDGFPNPVVEYGVVTQSELDMLKQRMIRNLGKQMGAERHSDQDIESLVMDRLMYIPLWRQPSTIARARAIRRAHLMAFPLKGYVEPPDAEPPSDAKPPTGDAEGLSPGEERAAESKLS